MVRDEKHYSYYRCRTTHNWHSARKCNSLTFRADQVDAEIWDWIKELPTDPQAVTRGLRKFQVECDREKEPIRARLDVVDDLLAENRQQLERLVDLYLSGEFPKETLTDRKTRFEKTVLALEKERASLVAHLEAGELTQSQINTLEDFAKMADGIDVADADFETRRGVIKALDEQAYFWIKDGQKVVRAHCMLGEKAYNLRPAAFVV